MALVPVGEVWGVGRRLSESLAGYGIHTALDLARRNPGWIRKQYNVVLSRTVAELNGHSCLSLEQVRPARQQIISSRSFGTPVCDQQSLGEALAEYTARAAEKLRSDQLLCQNIRVFAQSNRFKADHTIASRMVALPAPTADTRDLVHAVTLVLPTLYQEGVAYSKAGVSLSQIISTHHRQPDLFTVGGIRNDEHLMSILDKLNHGKRHNIYLAAQGVSQPWGMRRDNLSPAYTKRWSDIPVVH